MFVALALALFAVPFTALYVCERLARAGKGPLAEPDRMLVLDGAVVAAPVEEQPSSDEGRLVAALIAGDLDRARYRERMAELAARDAAIRPVPMPPEPA